MSGVQFGPSGGVLFGPGGGVAFDADLCCCCRWAQDYVADCIDYDPVCGGMPTAEWVASGSPYEVTGCACNQASETVVYDGCNATAYGPAHTDGNCPGTSDITVTPNNANIPDGCVTAWQYVGVYEATCGSCSGGSYADPSWTFLEVDHVRIRWTGSAWVYDEDYNGVVSDGDAVAEQILIATESAQHSLDGTYCEYDTRAYSFGPSACSQGESACTPDAPGSAYPPEPYCLLYYVYKYCSTVDILLSGNCADSGVECPASPTSSYVFQGCFSFAYCTNDSPPPDPFEADPLCTDDNGSHSCSYDKYWQYSGPHCPGDAQIAADIAACDISGQTCS